MAGVRTGLKSFPRFAGFVALSAAITLPLVVTPVLLVAALRAGAVRDLPVIWAVAMAGGAVLLLPVILAGMALGWPLWRLVLGAGGGIPAAAAAVALLGTVVLAAAVRLVQTGLLAEGETPAAASLLLAALGVAAVAVPVAMAVAIKLFPRAALEAAPPNAAE